MPIRALKIKEFVMIMIINGTITATRVKYVLKVKLSSKVSEVHSLTSGNAFRIKNFDGYLTANSVSREMAILSHEMYVPKILPK
jgi:hypothetical protein